MPVELERPTDAAHGDYATNVALKLAGLQKRPPREVASELAAEAVERGAAQRAEAAGPGFVNLWVPDAWLAEGVRDMVDAGIDFGAGSAVERERIQVEMVSANPTGPVTVASARNGAYGDSVARLLDFAGHDVEREYYYNDAGAQMERFHASVDAVRGGEEPPEDGYRGDYMADLAALDGDPVPAMLERIEQTLERFRIHFDTWERESDLEGEVSAAVELLDTYEEDNAVWARTSAHGDDKDRVLIRSNGTPTYFAKDAAYIRRKLGGGFDHLVYVLGADHHGYVARLQALAEMLGYPRDGYRGSDLPARPPRGGRRGQEDVEAARRRRVPGRAPGGHRRRRSALVPRVARARSDHRARRRLGEGADQQEPRLLRPVRARPNRRDLPHNQPAAERRTGYQARGRPG